jgi:hypothetical protein
MATQATDERYLASGEVYQQIGPNYSNEERLVTAALRTATVPAAVIQTIRPPLPQIIPFPPRFGYQGYDERQVGIEQVIYIDRFYPTRRMDLSGGVVGWQSASRNVGNNDVW